MDELIILLKKYKENKDMESLEKIVKKMEPLIKKYAYKTHCMEYEDAKQELYITLIKALQYIEPERGVEKCLSYIKQAIHNKYRRLCHQNLANVKIQCLTDDLAIKDQQIKDVNFYIDFKNYIYKLSLESSTKAHILYLSEIKNMSDQQIATKLNMSKQYVNRIKNKHLRTFLIDYEN